MRTNSDLCHLQHKLIGFYNRDVYSECLQRGTDWVFKYSSLRFVCKGLKAVENVVLVSLVSYVSIMYSEISEKLNVLSSDPPTPKSEIYYFTRCYTRFKVLKAVTLKKLSHS